MIRHFMTREFLGFLVTGGLAACVNFGSRIMYNRWFDFSTSVVIAYLTGMLTAFVLARAFVFTQGTQSVHRSAFFFILVNGVAVIQTWAISMALYYLLPLAGVTRFVPEIAHAVGVAMPVFTSYLGHKKFSFR
jgi:putative flippase GtrA